MTQVAIVRVSQSYDQIEDRICLSVLDKAGLTRRLWLTQRLGVRLVQALTQWLDADIAQVTEGRHSSLLQSYEQSAAEAVFQGGEAVVADPGRSPVLLTTVDLSKAAGAYALTFRFGENAGEAHSGVLRMTSTELRQWLSILHRMWIAAEWPASVWPGWFLPGGAAAGSGLALH